MKYQAECSSLLGLLDERDVTWANAVRSAVEKSDEFLKRLLANLAETHADADVQAAAQQALDEINEAQSG